MLEQGSQTQTIRVPHSKEKKRAAIYKTISKNNLNLVKIYNHISFWVVRGPHKDLEGHMRPTGWMFETPVLEYKVSAQKSFNVWKSIFRNISNLYEWKPKSKRRKRNRENNWILLSKRAKL